VAVEVHRLEWDEQKELILSGRVDVAYVPQPIRKRGLRLVPLFAERRLAALRLITRLPSELACPRLTWPPSATCATYSPLRCPASRVPSAHCSDVSGPELLALLPTRNILRLLAGLGRDSRTRR
jgi:hypothetical protein